ncbi:hypothetical protein H920_07690 [Fukomys damarensis]|uniref:Uncharacterized protein n=1 Tax=Fukomys damarensis TaxID=885580 RepID=A0A091DKT3_FUKDA|nr:hypothetical protein H920_07690 [Fukomys damarensis]
MAKISNNQQRSPETGNITLHQPVAMISGSNQQQFIAKFGKDCWRPAEKETAEAAGIAPESNQGLVLAAEELIDRGV